MHNQRPLHTVKPHASRHGLVYCTTGHLWGESIGHRWISRIQVQEASMFSFCWHENAVEQVVALPVISGAITPICDVTVMVLRNIWRSKCLTTPGLHFNDYQKHLFGYRDSHIEDKTTVRPYYICNIIFMMGILIQKRPWQSSIW